MKNNLLKRPCLLTGLLIGLLTAVTLTPTSFANRAESQGASNLSKDNQIWPQNVINGGIAIVALEERPIQPPEWNGRPLLHFADPQGQWFAALGIPLDSGETISIQSNQKSYHIDLATKDYPEQYITIANKRQVNPQQRDLTRIQSEYQQMRPIYQSYTQTLYHPYGKMLRPVKGVTSSPFGLKRFFNKQPRSPHSGLDIAAPEGTPIQAPAAGKIVLTGDFFFNGNSVFIDHGQGLISMMCHLQRIDVKQGEQVAAGDLLGTVGKTGRATGPHLHWTVSLNNNRIDPTIFLADDQ